MYVEHFLGRTSSGMEVMVAAYCFVALFSDQEDGGKPRMLLKSNKELLDGFILRTKKSVANLRNVIANSKIRLKLYGEAQVELQVLLSRLLLLLNSNY